MSGHSKWAQIKRQKGVADARRGQLFTKLVREITVSARQGGGDPDANARLRLAVQTAREANMPAENIKRAIERGIGGGDAAALEEITYEGYGPGGAAILVQAMTDNRKRTVADIRNVFTRAAGSLGESGCVAWMFDARGVISVDANSHDAEDLALKAIDAGAEDVQVQDGSIDVYTEPTEFESVREGLAQAGIGIASAELAMVPKTTLEASVQDAVAVLKLLEKLEDLDDVQRVYTNVDFTDEVLADVGR
jgi:YebC/PmpR family DNA-binding regulatory protein